MKGGVVVGGTVNGADHEKEMLKTIMIREFERALRSAKNTVGLTQAFWVSVCHVVSDKLKKEFGVIAKFSLEEGEE